MNNDVCRGAYAAHVLGGDYLDNKNPVLRGKGTGKAVAPGTTHWDDGVLISPLHHTGAWPGAQALRRVLPSARLEPKEKRNKMQSGRRIVVVRGPEQKPDHARDWRTQASRNESLRPFHGDTPHMKGYSEEWVYPVRGCEKISQGLGAT